jgi:hypothetical protein
VGAAAAAAAAVDSLYTTPGVDQVFKGSAVALAFIELTSDAPANEFAAAITRLKDNADSLYASTSMPTEWGKLQSFLVAPSRAELFSLSSAAGGRGTAEDAQAEGHLSSRAVLTAGGIAGIVIGCFCLVGLMGFVLWKALTNEKAKAHDADLTAKLDYCTELKV